MKWFKRSKKEKGWLVIDESPAELKYLHGAPGSDTASLFSWASVKTEGGALERAAKDKHFERYRCGTLLRPGEYHLIMVDAPAVPEAELKGALRWSIKDRVDSPVEEMTLDALEIPPVNSAAGRARAMFAVAAKNEVIADLMRRFDKASIPLDVIDIPETAQRNIAALYESERRATALLFLERDTGLLTVNYGKELYLARRLDTGIDQIMKYPVEARQDPFERIQLELQRTFDHFDRQHGVPVSRLLIGPEPADTGIEAHMRASFDFAVERVNLPDRLKLAPGLSFDAATQWQMFHLTGAALRDESRAA